MNKISPESCVTTPLEDAFLTVYEKEMAKKLCGSGCKVDTIAKIIMARRREVSPSLSAVWQNALEEQVSHLLRGNHDDGDSHIYGCPC